MIHEKDLATSRPEFFRNLAVALNGMAHEINGDHITVGSGATTIDMRLAPLPPRVLSPLLKLERWKLTMEFNGHTDKSRDEFLAVFDQAFRRGGG
ncbi:MAG: hypothetical protein HKN11_11855 [Rhizobiales bacterium]|nr:hypothetical protein [Hyphomicrobiales bacterium]